MMDACINLIQGRDRQRFPSEIDQMHRLRKRVFHDRLKWDVSVIGEWEIDGYDAMDPLYVLSTNSDSKVTAGLRLLPTTGPNMLNYTFPELLPWGRVITDPRIWESSRFVIDRHSVSPLMLGQAMNEIGMARGWTHVVTVYDYLFHCMLKRQNCEGELLSEPRMIGGVKTCAVIYTIGEELEQRLRKATGITGSVLPKRQRDLRKRLEEACCD
jgi:N-acyl-L-homoserine lactone synthetase